MHETPVQRLVLGTALTAAGAALILRPGLHTHRELNLLKRKIEAMEDLNQQTQQLAHHQRLELLGTLTSSIAHEFNNLLTPIMGYSLMALEKLPRKRRSCMTIFLRYTMPPVRLKTSSPVSVIYPEKTPPRPSTKLHRMNW